MNITKDIAKEIGGDFENIINSINEIEIYSDHDMFRYLWQDCRFENTSDVMRDDNNKFKTRSELKEAIKEHLIEKGE